ncbi:hypothetical protein A6R68_19577 [Neotoma lepida]|uniref:Large ribosomal subunit protein eL36 n=1 Tax=Neotoma lepida TaxID=56216 RepID=A0A1A6HHJ7_NEOLE|nr:hypothetical protein A6R68_19577 [Neotoma lepida]
MGTHIRQRPECVRPPGSFFSEEPLPPRWGGPSSPAFDHGQPGGRGPPPGQRRWGLEGPEGMGGSEQVAAEAEVRVKPWSPAGSLPYPLQPVSVRAVYVSNLPYAASTSTQVPHLVVFVISHSWGLCVSGEEQRAAAPLSFPLHREKDENQRFLNVLTRGEVEMSQLWGVRDAAAECRGVRALWKTMKLGKSEAREQQPSHGVHCPLRPTPTLECLWYMMREVCALRVAAMEHLKMSKDKSASALKFIKKRVGTYIRAKKTRKELSNVLATMRKAATKKD